MALPIQARHCRGIPRRQESCAAPQRLAGLSIEERRKPQTGTMKLTLGGAQARGESTNRRQPGPVNTCGCSSIPRPAIICSSINLDSHRHSWKRSGHRSRKTAAWSSSAHQKAWDSPACNTAFFAATTPSFNTFKPWNAILKKTSKESPKTNFQPMPSLREEYKSVDWVISQEPNVIMVNKVEDSRSAVDLINYCKEGRRVYISMRAFSTFDALNQWRKLVGDDSLAVESLQMIINGRSDPEVVQQLQGRLKPL